MLNDGFPYDLGYDCEKITTMMAMNAVRTIERYYKNYKNYKNYVMSPRLNGRCLNKG